MQTFRRVQSSVSENLNAFVLVDSKTNLLGQNLDMSIYVFLLLVKVRN